MPQCGDTSNLGQGKSNRKDPEKGGTQKNVLLLLRFPLLLVILLSGGFEE